MTTKLPVTELKDLATALALSANAGDAVLADGRVDGKDLFQVGKLLTAIRGFGAVDFKEIIPEALDIDAQESTELAAHFAATFNLSNDAVEATVEQGLALVLQGVQAIQAIWEVFGRIRGKEVPSA